MAELFAFFINMLNGIRQGHCTARIGAMDQSERVAKFMHRLLHHAVLEQRYIRGKAIEFLSKAAEGDHRCRSVQLRVSEHETEHRYEQIMFRDPQDADGIGWNAAKQILQNKGGIPLSGLLIEGIGRIRKSRTTLHIESEHLPETDLQ